MEKTVTSPYWTGLTLFSVGHQGQAGSTRKRHKLHEAMYMSKQRVAYKGQLFSAPMDWRSIVDQLEDMQQAPRVVDLPVSGAILEKRVKVSITSGLVELDKLVKQATVRYDVMVRLIALHKDAGEKDYQSVNLKDVAKRAKELNPTNEPRIPECLHALLDSSEDEHLDDGTDKAATPAERNYSADNLVKELDRLRPTTLVVQRDSDASKDVEASRHHALGTVTTVNIQTGSDLLAQFNTEYIPKVFNLTLPRQVGGPDFPGSGQQRWRRRFDDAPQLTLSCYTSMLAKRVEAQVRWDWDLVPGLHTLSFASKVNQSVGIGLARGLKRLEDANEEASDTHIGLAMKRLYELLYTGEYLDDLGKRRQIKGDISKLHKVLGLTPLQNAVIRNMFFMSARLPGTRQVRKMIGHLLTAARVVYGCPVFMTVTPSERHSGLTVHLTRYRRGDPGIKIGSPEFTDLAGYKYPSIYEDPEDVESCAIELPEYDLRRILGVPRVAYVLCVGASSGEPVACCTLCSNALRSVARCASCLAGYVSAAPPDTMTLYIYRGMNIGMDKGIPMGVLMGVPMGMLMGMPMRMPMGMRMGIRRPLGR